MHESKDLNFYKNIFTGETLRFWEDDKKFSQFNENQTLIGSLNAFINKEKCDFENHMQKVRKFARSLKWIRIHTIMAAINCSYNVFVTTDTK